MNVLDNFKNAIHAGNDTYDPKVWWYIFDPLINKFALIFTTVQQLPYTAGIYQDLYNPTTGGASHNVCNFSADENYIYISQTVDGPLGGSFAYAVHYGEYSSTIMWHMPDASAGYSSIWWVDRSGNFYSSGDGTHVFPTNIHTGVQGPLVYYYGIQIAAPDNYYTAILYTYSETSTGSPTNYVITGVIHTLPANGGYILTHVGDTTIYAGSYNQTTRVNLRSLFTKEFTSFPFNTVQEIYTLEKGTFDPSQGWFKGTYFQSFSWFVYTPYGDSVDCGSVSFGINIGPYQRKWPISWSHLQGKTNLFQSLMITTEMYQGMSFVESDRRIYINGNRIDSILAAAAGIDVSNILGLVYTPRKEV
jgi:hypothetical protein